jgi:hypothetical protein
LHKGAEKTINNLNHPNTIRTECLPNKNQMRYGNLNPAGCVRGRQEDTVTIPVDNDVNWSKLAPGESSRVPNRSLETSYVVVKMNIPP